jgi:hypothetical protein
VALVIHIWFPLCACVFEVKCCSSSCAMLCVFFTNASLLRAYLLPRTSLYRPLSSNGRLFGLHNSGLSAAVPQYYRKVAITDGPFSEIRDPIIITVPKMSIVIVLSTVGRLKLWGGGCFWWHDLHPKFYSDLSIASKIISKGRKKHTLIEWLMNRHTYVMISKHIFHCGIRKLGYEL